MNKIINGKRYDTETAKVMGCAGNDVPANDFTFWQETLYRTKSGNYFLHGEGHGNSRYGEWHGNSGGWGEKIMPFTEDSAKEWVEENLSADEYSEIFGEITEKEKISAEISSETRETLDRIKGKMSYGDIITKMVKGWENGTISIAPKNLEE